MIDSDYHSDLTMTLTTIRKQLALTTPEPDPAWDPGTNSAITSLLDHLAEELALEYVRLMEEAAGQEASDRRPQCEER